MTGLEAGQPGCVFCDIAAGRAEAVILWEDEAVMAFLDIAPVRAGHTQVIPKRHYESFEVLPSELAGKILGLGQELAKRMKAVYQVDRVAFAFAGSDVAHAHAHILPIHARTDITSARYLVGSPELRWSPAHLRADRATLLAVRNELGFIA